MPDDTVIDGVNFKTKERRKKKQDVTQAPAAPRSDDEEAALVAAFSAPGCISWEDRKWFGEEVAKMLCCRNIPAMGLIYINEHGEPDMVWMSVSRLATRAFADGFPTIEGRVRAEFEDAADDD